MVKKDVNNALNILINTSKNPILSCIFNTNSNNMSADREDSIVNISKLAPIRTNEFRRRQKMVIQRKSKIALVVEATEYTLLKDLFTFKNRINKRTEQIPKTVCPNR